MFTDLDSELYPDVCEVAEIPGHSQWVYLIFKNGSSSIRYDRLIDYPIYRNHDIARLDQIDIYIRDPKDRYISGVNSFVQFVLRDNPGQLDQNTVAWMACRYRFLNRHYLPQLLWLFNLARYLKKDTLLRFRRFEDYHEIMRINFKPPVAPIKPELRTFILENSAHMDIWWYADQVLGDLAGTSMTWTELKNHYKTQHLDLWNHVTQTARDMTHVLS